MPRTMAHIRGALLMSAAGLAVSAFAGIAAADPQEPVIGAGDDASFLIFMATDGGVEQQLNGDMGPASIERGSLDFPHVAGASHNSPSANILVGWDEIYDNRPGDAGIFSRVRFDISTSDGSSFISEDAANNGFNFLRWEIGAHADPADQAFADAIGFRPFVEDVVMVEARAVFFNDDVQLNSLAFGFTLGIGSTWDGTDAMPGNLFSVGSDVNRIEITYDYDATFVPAPTTASLLLGAGLLGARRRRP